jgi:flagellar hook-length control protein FliK
MQAAVKFFDLPFQGAGGQGADKIGIKLPQRTTEQLSGEESGFLEIMAALTRIPPQELKSSLAQLDWVQVEDSAGEFAPLIDLTDQTGAQKSILQMLLSQQRADAQAPPPPATLPAGQPDAAAWTGALHPQALDGPSRGAPSQEMPTQGADATVSGEANRVSTAASQRVADIEALLAKESAGRTAEQFTAKTGSGSPPADADTHPSNSLKQWLDSQASMGGKPLSEKTPGGRTVSDPAESTARALPWQPSEHPIVPESIEQKNRFGPTQLHRQATQTPKIPDENVAAAQEAVLQNGQTSKREPLDRAVRMEASSSARLEKSFAVTSSESAEMQMNSNANREGSPSLDTPMRATAVKSVEAGGAAKEAMPFNEPETQIDVVRQIVQRMTLRSDRQQSQMVIRLKPDFLGQVRLQVTTEGQQVMVRMDAESVMVKEIVEQNMAHLKAELSQHGLEIEKFDVFVGNDNDGWRSGQQQAGFRQASKRSGKPSDQASTDDDGSHQPKDSSNQGPRAASSAAGEVDYFA